MIKIAVIDSNSTDLYVLSINRDELLDINGDFCEDKIIQKFNEHFQINLHESEISWGEIDKMFIDLENSVTEIF